MRGRNTVILAGWLGCKRKSLSRLEAMYREMGWGVIVRIASPLLVVKSSTGLFDSSCNTCATYTPTPSQPPRAAAAAAAAAAARQRQPRSMRELALQILQQVEESQCSSFVFHGFSNGGGFLWEDIRNLINNRGGNTAKYASLRSKLSGVVFDSSPAYYDPGRRMTLYDALSYATEEDQREAKILLDARCREVGDLQFTKLLQKRAREYWDGMWNDDTNVPHLYLYSEVDSLTPFKRIDELIEHRRSLYGNDRISAVKFIDSPHVCHFLKYPDQYQLALAKFLSSSSSSGGSSLKSKL